RGRKRFHSPCARALARSSPMIGDSAQRPASRAAATSRWYASCTGPISFSTKSPTSEASSAARGEEEKSMTLTVALSSYWRTGSCPGRESSLAGGPEVHAVRAHLEDPVVVQDDPRRVVEDAVAVLSVRGPQVHGD